MTATRMSIGLVLMLMGSSALAAVPAAWESLAPSECARLSEAAWIDHGWPIDKKDFPRPSCTDFEHFSSSQTLDFLVHQDEYTGGGGFYRWFVLEGFGGGHAGILAQSRAATARFASIADERFLEQFDGEWITLSRWRYGRLQTVLKYRANDFAFQLGPVFGALRAFDPAARELFVVKYKADGRDAILKARYSWQVDRYAPSGEDWKLVEVDMPLSKALRSKLKRADPSFARQLAVAEMGNFSFDTEFGWNQLRGRNGGHN